jgi:hypothetical protein
MEVWAEEIRSLVVLIGHHGLLKRDQVGPEIEQRRHEHLAACLAVAAPAPEIERQDPHYETTSAAGPTIRVYLGTTSSTLSWAQKAISSSSPGGP